MSGEALVKVENVSKKFCRSLKRSLWYGLQDIGMEVMGRKYERELRPDEFWAVKDVSVELRRGECLGLIGPNGAGKSTLLKMLNGLIKPDKGRIEIRGRVGALIELGMGFNPILTGLENIYNNAAVLGITKAEIDRQLDSIISFAEIGEFINMPVQNYSSGMKVRLGFAVAAHLYPDVMIIDEVLAVGDIGFRAKCLEYISKMLKKTAVIFVSHSMPVVNRYCTRVMSLNKGRVVSCGEPAEVIEEYYDFFEAEHGRVTCLPGNELKEFVLMDTNNRKIEEIEYSSMLRVKIAAVINASVKYPIFKILFLNRELQIVAACQFEPDSVINQNGLVSLMVDIHPLILSPSKYKLSLVVHNQNFSNPLIWYDAYWNLWVRGEEINFGSASIRFRGIWQSLLSQ